MEKKRALPGSCPGFECTGCLLELMQRLHHPFIVKVAVKSPSRTKTQTGCPGWVGTRDLSRLMPRTGKAGKGVVQGTCAVLAPEQSG